MEPFQTTIFSTENPDGANSANPKQRFLEQKQQKQQLKQQQKQQQQQNRKNPHTTKRKPLDLSNLSINEKIEREEEQEELAKQKTNNNNKNNNNKNNNKINKGGISYSRPPADATEILPFLYLGSALNAEDAELARALRLSCVLNVAEELLEKVASAQENATQDATTAQTQENATQDATTTQAQENATQDAAAQTTCVSIETQCERMSIVVHDAVPDNKHQFDIFEQAFLVIDKAKESDRPVLVHCMRGRSRSATIVIGYLMTRNKWTLKEAYTHVKKLRPFIGPHRRLKKQLVDFEQHLYGTVSVPAGTAWQL